MSSADRWPLTSAWHTGEWTSEVCEHLRDQVSDLIRDNRLRAQRAISSRDWAADDECAERSRYLRACEDELDDRAAARRRWERAQWTGTSHHWLLRWGLLGSVLRAAREGTLTPDWRGGLDAAVGERNRQAAFEADADVAALVVHELSTMSPQPWEPYVAGGDWPAAPVVLAAMPPRRYEERKAAAGGVVAVRVVELERAVEKPPAKPTVDEAIKIVLASPRAWRAVLAELTRRAHEGAFDRWGGHECDRNNIAAVRFTNAVATYTRARVYEERRRLQRSWEAHLARPPQDRDVLGW